jgi:antitoxin VapB
MLQNLSTLAALDLYTPKVYANFMTQSTVFKTNKTQAVRLPKALAFPDSVKKVNITQQGNSLLITPVGGNWDDFFNGPRIDDDFIKNRNQPPPQEREDW